MATIQILGTGCSRCSHLQKNAEQAVKELGHGDVVEKISDIVFAVALSLGAKSLGFLFQKVTATEQKIRLITGIVILLIGIWLTLQHVFQVIG